jgi:hypothetical protein
LSATPGSAAGGRYRRVWAPVLAGLAIALLYSARVDSNFYFLYGAEAQGILLADALATGQGMVDLSLPGHPAHVREPPLFYFLLSVLIRLFGLRLLPLKLAMWAGYVGSAVLGTMLFQRRCRPGLAALGVVFALSAPELFRFATGPKSDLPFAAVALAALLAGESLLDRFFAAGGELGKRIWPWAALTAGLIAAAALTRSLGLSLLVAFLGAVILGRGGPSMRRRITIALAVLLPVALALGAWSLRGARAENPAGYGYLDWFLMDLEPDSPEMTAVDFHAPLMDRVPRASLAAAAARAARRLPFYGALDGGLLFNLNPGDLQRRGPAYLFLLALPVMLLGLWAAERGRPPLVPLFLLVYSAVLIVWPMNDQRLVYPLLPFAGFYFLLGLTRLPAAAGAIRRQAGRAQAAAIERSSRWAEIGTAILILTVMAWNQTHNLSYWRALAGLPGVELSPGFQVRFLSAETARSYQLLAWARAHAEPGAILMYHSPPPCRLVTGHECRSIPFTADLQRAHDYLLAGGADYLILDEWGRIYPGGPGLFVERILRPLVAAYPADFTAVHVIGGTPAAVYRVNRR